MEENTSKASSQTADMSKVVKEPRKLLAPKKSAIRARGGGNKVGDYVEP